MNKIDLDKLKKYIENKREFHNLDVSINYNATNDENYLSLGCIDSVSENYVEFGCIFEDGLFTMIYGGINLIEVFDNTDYYAEEDETLDPYNELIDIIVSAIEQDIEDEKILLDDVKYAIGLEN